MHFLLAALALLLGACVVNLNTRGTFITCDSPDDCPSDRVCALDIGRCVSRDADVTPPALTSTLSVTPKLVGSSGSAVISFAVNEILDATPSVVIEWPDGFSQPALLSDETYSFSFVPDAATPEGTADIVVTLLDEQGNKAVVRVPSAIVFDFTPPAVIEGSVSLSLAPAVTNPRQRVSAATIGTRVVAELVTTELLAAGSSVSVGLAFALVPSKSGTVAVEYQAAVPDTAPDGEHTVSLLAIDAAGNSSSVTLGSVIIDATPPLPPKVDVADALLLRRLPFGSLTSAPRVELVSQAGAAEAGGLLEAFESNAPGAARLAEATIDATGAFPPLQLPLTLGARVSLRVIDGAGNVSPRVATRDGEWVAHPSAQGPIEARTTRASSPNLQPLTASAADSDVLATPSGARDGSIVVAAAASWQKRSFADGSFPRASVASAYDTRRSAMFAFGGRGAGNAIYSGLWRFDGADWSKMPVIGEEPTPRFAASMAYDSVRDRLVLFGGVLDGASTQEVWEFNGSSWQAIPVSGLWPSARAWHGMSYDSARRVTVLFGGCTAPETCTDTLLDDTWEWNGTSWRSVTYALGDAHPAPRAAFGITYADSLNGNEGVVIAAGCASGAQSPLIRHCMSTLNDSWVWNGSRWHEGPPFSSRAYHSLIYDSKRARVVAAGGCLKNPTADECRISSLQLYSFAWTGSANWEFLPLDTAPQRIEGLLGYDAARDQVVTAFGYYSEPGYPNQDTAASADGGEAYALIADYTQPPPSPRAGASAAFGAGQTIFVGGRTQNGAANAEVFAYRNGTWSKHPTLLPTARFGASVVADPGRAALVVFGGTDGTLVFRDTLETPLTLGGGWALACDGTAGPCAVSPYPALWSSAFAFDPIANVMQMIGGRPVADPLAIGTSAGYAWDGTNWAAGQFLTPEVVEGILPPASHRAGASMVYDSLRDSFVLFGGRLFQPPNNLFRDDTWTWSLTTSLWARACDTLDCSRPSARQDFGLVYDSGRARTVLLGGRGTTATFLNDLWEWDSTTWRKITTTGGGPEPSAEIATAYEPGRQRLITFGGETFGSMYSGDLWELDLSGQGRAMAFVDVDVSDADVSGDVITQVQVQSGAGGRGYTIDASLVDDADVLGAPVPGVELLAWDWLHGVWTTVATTSADVDAPAALLGSIANAGPYVDPLESTFHLAFKPTTGTGNAAVPGELSVDYVDVTVRYRLP